MPADDDVDLSNDEVEDHYANVIALPTHRVNVERFWSHVEVPDNDFGCWEWAAFTDEDGYGILNAPDGRWRAHRASWTFANGPIPGGMLVLHQCDNPPCVRPNHLYLGTRVDNMRDRVARNRDQRLAEARWLAAGQMRLPFAR